LAADGKRALSGSMDHTMRLWDVGTGRQLHLFEGHAASLCCVALAPDGRTALSGSWDKTLRLWRVPADPPPPRQGKGAAAPGAEGRRGSPGRADAVVRVAALDCISFPPRAPCAPTALVWGQDKERSQSGDPRRTPKRPPAAHRVGGSREKGPP